MKFRVRDFKDQDEEIIELWLEEGKNGEVILKGRNKNDTDWGDWFIMSFKDGKFRRIGLVGLEGLKTDEKGRILEEE